MWKAKVFSPNIFFNGLLWIVGIALQIGGWLSQIVAYILLGLAFIWTTCTLMYWLKLRNRGRRQEVVIQFKEPYELEIESGTECGLIFVNRSANNLEDCQARLLGLEYETPQSRFTLSRLLRSAKLVCDTNVAGYSEGKLSLVRWGRAYASKASEFIYQGGTEKVAYDIANVPILFMLNIWAKDIPATYAICKISDRLGSGYDLSILKTGLQKDNPKLEDFQRKTADTEASQT